MADPDRRGGGGLSLRTLVIASAASLTAAMVTSRLFPPGTIYASALTPVIVAAATEFLNRPVDRVTALREQRRTMVLEAARGGDPHPLEGAPDFAQGAAADDELYTNGHGAGGTRVRIHGRRRILHPKVWIATGLAAFAIAVAVLTLPELIFGGAVANKHRTTFFGGGSSATKTQTTTTETTQQTAPETVTETVPAQTPPPTTTTETQTTPTETQSEPSGGTPAPSDTGTETSPTPGGVVPPPPS